MGDDSAGKFRSLATDEARRKWMGMVVDGMTGTFRLLFSLLPFLVPLVPLDVHALQTMDETVLTDAEVREAIDGYRADLAELRERLGIPGLSVAIARDGEVLWAEGFGWADREAARKATADTPYRIASITKTMTAAVVVGLAHEGTIDLDAPVSRYLPEGPDWTERVTVRQVLSHTSESDPPGTAFAYSGRYDLLSRVAEEAAGTSFPRLLVERVVEPAEMSRTYPVSLDSTERARGVRAELATGYLPNGEPAPEGTLRSRTVGGNGVVSTAPDLVRWASALADGRVVPEPVRSALWTPTVSSGGDTLPYGLGWWVEETPAVRLVSHGGQWPTYSGLLLHVRGPDLTLAVLANGQAVSSPFYDIGTGTRLYSTFVASFLRRFALRDLWDGAPPELPWDVSADSLAAVVRGYDSGAARLHLGAELFGRGLVAKATGAAARSDSLLRAVADCCPAALDASEDLGLLFHLGRSGDPELRGIGQEAGRRRLRRMPDDRTTRFHLAVSHAQSGEGAEARRLLRRLLGERSEIPTWMWSWSAYLMAEQIADERPAEARRLLERVLEEGQDEGGLFEQVRALLEDLRSAHPEARAHHQLVYHAAEGRAYLVGGSTPRGEGHHYFDDVWSWDGDRWTREPSLPFPRSSHRVVYDRRRDALVLFGGGFGGAVRTEGVLWERRRDGWKAIGGSVAAGRGEPGVCYDGRRDRVVVFGGWDGESSYRGDTWEWTGAELLRVDSAGPARRAGHAFLFDPVRRRCLLFGGRGPDGYLADTWLWDGESWTRLAVAGPPARWFFGAATDSGNGRVVIFGGRGPDAPEPGRDDSGDLGDTWAWDGERWQRLSAPGPSPRSMARMAFTGEAVILFGGRSEAPEGFSDHADTWELRGATWTRRGQ